MSIVSSNRTSSSRNQQQQQRNNESNNKPKKSVSFDNSNNQQQQVQVCVEIQEIERLDNDDNDRSSLWYNKKDFEKFKRRDRKMCKLLFGGTKMDPNILEFMTGGNETPRGLENMSPFKQQLRMARQKACAEAIAMLEKQQKQQQQQQQRNVLFCNNNNLLPSSTTTTNESSNESKECIVARIHQDFSAKAKADAIKLALRDAQFVNDHILSSSVRRRRVSCISSLSPELLQQFECGSDNNNNDDSDDDSDEQQQQSKSRSRKSSRRSRPAMLERTPAMLDLVRYTTI